MAKPRTGKTYMHHGIEIVASYFSKSGTGRNCNTVQGYEYQGFTGRSWHESLKEARAEIDRAYSYATGESPFGPNMRIDYIKWIARTFDGEAAREEIDRREAARVRNAEKDRMAALAKAQAMDVIRAAARDSVELARALDLIHGTELETTYHGQGAS